MRIKLNTIVKIFIVSAVLGAGVSYSKLYLFHICFVLILLAFFYKIVENRKIIIAKLPTKLHYFFLYMFFWYFISIIWSINELYSLKYLFYIFIGSSLSLIIIYYANNKENLIGIYKVASIVFILQIIIGLLEALTIFRWPLSPYSPYIVYFGRTMGIGTGLSESALKYVHTLPTGFLTSPNYFAVGMSIIFPFFLFKKEKFGKHIGIISLLFLIFATSSRGTFIAVILVLFFFSFFYGSRRFLKSYLLVSLIIFCAVTAFALFDFSGNFQNIKINEVLNSFNAFGRLIQGLFDGVQIRNESISVRVLLLQNAFSSILNNFFLGVGGGGSIAVQEIAGNVPGGTLSMHNFWAEVLVDTGIIFTAVFLVWYFLIMIKLYIISFTKIDNTIKYFAMATSLSMAGFMISCISASSVIYQLPMWMLFGFAVATINNYERIKSENSISGKS